MTSDKDRYCDEDELWVCVHCGKHVDHDRFDFDDESCMLNAAKVKKKFCHYQNDNPNERIIKVDGE